VANCAQALVQARRAEARAVDHRGARAIGIRQAKIDGIDLELPGQLVDLLFDRERHLRRAVPAERPAGLRGRVHEPRVPGHADRRVQRAEGLHGHSHDRGPVVVVGPVVHRELRLERHDPPSPIGAGTELHGAGMPALRDRELLVARVRQSDGTPGLAGQQRGKHLVLAHLRLAAEAAAHGDLMAARPPTGVGQRAAELRP